jgi:hypothetical protein
MVGWRRFKSTNDLAPSFTIVNYDRNDSSQYIKTMKAAKARIVNYDLSYAPNWSIIYDCKLQS